MSSGSPTKTAFTMSVALIEESAKEVRRLAIAGSPLAIGDFRLKKLIAPLEQAGTKVPVFAQVAKSISDVVNGTEADSAARLLNLSTLLNAILYTQGQSGAVGDYRELEVFATNCASTRTTARVLKPLIEALTSSGGGRFEIIKTAVERGTFSDMRLIGPSIQALGDNYPEIADLVAEKILPAYGPGIVPQLKVALDLKGKKHDARKLMVMHQLDPAGTVELCKTALEDGSTEVKAAAIACLGKHEDCLPLVLEQANAKNKLLRAAALEALAEHDRPDVTKLFIDLVKGKALDALAGPFRSLRNRQVLNALLEEGRRVFESIIKGDSEQISRFCEILDCLAPRKDAEVEAFLLGGFAKSDALIKIKAVKNPVITSGTSRYFALAGTDLMERLTVLLYDIGSPKALEAILAKRQILSPAVFLQIWRSALRLWPADKVFEEFSPLLEQTKGAGKEKSLSLQRAIHAAHDDRVAEAVLPAGKTVTWDPRWLDAAIKADAQLIVYNLARPNHKASLDYLLKQPKAKEEHDVGFAVRALARCHYPQATDLFLEQVARKTKGAKYLDYEMQSLLANAKYLPAADLPKLDAFAAKLDEKFVDHFLEAIAPLRPAGQPIEATSN
jgi:hypothetical protein